MLLDFLTVGVDENEEFLVVWEYEPSRVRTILVRNTLMRMRVPGVVFATRLCDDMSPHSFYAYATDREPLHARDAVMHRAHQMMGWVCLGEEAEDLIYNRKTDPVTAYWMTSFADLPGKVVGVDLLSAEQITDSSEFRVFLGLSG